MNLLEGALFYEKVPLKARAPPPTLTCFLRPCPPLVWPGYA